MPTRLTGKWIYTMYYKAGRMVHQYNVLQHELMTVLVAVAYTNGSLRVGNTLILADVMTKDVTCPPEITPNSIVSGDIWPRPSNDTWETFRCY